MHGWRPRWCAVSNMLEARMILHVDHARIRLRGASIISFLSTFVVVIIITTASMFVCKVRRTLVLMRAAIVLEAADDLIDIR